MKKNEIMQNQDIRLLAKMKGIPLWMIAEKLQISEPTMTRWMRTFNVEHRNKIMKAIEQIEGEKT